MIFFIQFLPFVFLLILGVTVGGFMERAHLKRLAKREAVLGHMLVNDLGTLPDGCEQQPFSLVTGEVVIASDYFKTFSSGLRSIVGGELRSFDTLMGRARREALLRMLESAQRMGANGVINIRYSTSNIGSMRRRHSAAMVEMYASGTAIHVRGH